MRNISDFVIRISFVIRHWSFVISFKAAIGHFDRVLLTLRIKNLALVSELVLEFGPGYNVITGETGAGKSIVIGALNLVLGERADRTLIRSGSESCSLVSDRSDVSSSARRLRHELARADAFDKARLRRTIARRRGCLSPLARDSAHRSDVYRSSRRCMRRSLSESATASRTVRRLSGMSASCRER